GPLEPVLGLSSLQQPVGTHWGARPGTAVNLCVSLWVPQAVPMDLRIGQRFVKPGSDTALLVLKQTQQLQHQLFLASLHQQQVEQFTHQHMRVGTPSRASGGPQGQAPGCGDTSHQQPLGRVGEALACCRHTGSLLQSVSTGGVELVATPWL
uniref:Histone deacetylase n=1 Tax=Terrapene triunguis TaxID=2587831 RepID=A0A674JIP2_9SAUR